MKEHTPSKRPIIYYAVVAAIMLLLLNALVFPGLLQAEVKEVGYNEFLSMVEKGEVTEVARDEAAGTITFTTGKDSTFNTTKQASGRMIRWSTVSIRRACSSPPAFPRRRPR
jgi:hypothetical protein